VFPELVVLDMHMHVVIDRICIQGDRKKSAITEVTVNIITTVHEILFATKMSVKEAHEYYKFSLNILCMT